MQTSPLPIQMFFLTVSGAPGVPKPAFLISTPGIPGAGGALTKTLK